MPYLVIEAHTAEGRRNLKLQEHRIQIAMGNATAKFMMDILARSKPKVPKKTGKLENSGFSYLNKGLDRAEGVLGYKALNPKWSPKWGHFNYAPIQHDRCDFKHPIKGQCKYLSETIDEMSGEWKDYVIREMKTTFTV